MFPVFSSSCVCLVVFVCVCEDVGVVFPLQWSQLNTCVSLTHHQQYLCLWLSSTPDSSVYPMWYTLSAAPVSYLQCHLFYKPPETVVLLCLRLPLPSMSSTISVTCAKTTQLQSSGKLHSPSRLTMPESQSHSLTGPDPSGPSTSPFNFPTSSFLKLPQCLRLLLGLKLNVT